MRLDLFIIASLTASTSGIYLSTSISDIEPCFGATTYYVSESGNDGNSGRSSDSPWRTIQKVNSSRFMPGDRILFKRGDVWRETLVVPGSGTALRPITFGAYGSGGKPVISGADAVRGWTRYRGNVWEATLTVQPRQVFFGRAKGIRRNSVENVKAVGEWCHESNTVYVYSTCDPDTGYAESGLAASQREACVASDGKEYVVLEGIECKRANSDGLFFYKSRHCMIRDVDVSFCHQNGIELASHCAENHIEACTSHHNGNLDEPGEPVGGGIMAHTGARDNVISHCISYANAEDGIILGGTDAATWVGIDNIVEDCNLHDNRESGIDVKNGPQTIRSNLVHHNTGANGEGHGVLLSFESNSVTVSDNRIYSNANDGIQVLARGSHHVLEGNRVYGNGDNGMDIESVDGGGSWMTIRYNRVYANHNDGLVFHDAASHHARVHNNVIWANGGSYQLLFTAADCTATNNILGNGATAIGFRQQAVHGANSNHNVLIGTGRYCMWDYHYCDLASYKAISGQDKDSLPIEPLFADAANGDFHLLRDSPAIEAGIDLGYSTEFEGTPAAVDRE